MSTCLKVKKGSGGKKKKKGPGHGGTCLISPSGRLRQEDPNLGNLVTYGDPDSKIKGLGM